MISQLALSLQDTLSKSVTLQTDKNNHQFTVIKHAKFDAVFALQGAHLIHFQLKNQPATIWLSKSAQYIEGKAIRGGVPVCWPWFGPANKELGENLPAHGFARTSLWSIKNINEIDEGVEIEFKLQDSSQTRKLWPYSFDLVLKATLTETLKLELITSNKGKTPFSYRGALHSYLNISAPNSCSVTGLNKQYTDSLNNKKAMLGDTTLLIDRPIDAIYKKSPSIVSLFDKQFNRQLTLLNHGNDSEVLWTPWINGAKTFTDMPDNGYQSMFCIEAAITNTNGELVEAGKNHRLTTIIDTNAISNEF